MKSFVLYRNTKSRCEFEKEEEAIEKMEDEGEIIDYEEFAENCEFEEIAKELGYDEDLVLEHDWHVTFSKSNFGGLPCYLFSHSECDFIFLRPEDSKMLNEFNGKEACGVNDLEWKRHTQYGIAGIDPT